MYHLDTPYPTIIFEDSFIDPSTMDHVIKKKKKKRISQQLWYKDKYNPYVSFICDIASSLLNQHNFNYPLICKDWFKKVSSNYYLKFAMLMFILWYEENYV